ncbi:uncharacterized protein Tco025E_07109 [Trypanosoma conorhini]|uniref:Uncharacterized protein n=1 Tax=Trypanosoma conorhini TaxID=83891 RepID=A0A3R7NMH9_9TRYP|nr:uncharacterized protein Tco025E_07109 [Trypanosoma conorhini]RNF08666.1 hypothetical protein Tco025E_07109 [Trypanosoma conorhini]
MPHCVFVCLQCACTREQDAKGAFLFFSFFFAWVLGIVCRPVVDVGRVPAGEACEEDGNGDKAKIPSGYGRNRENHESDIVRAFVMQPLSLFNVQAHCLLLLFFNLLFCFLLRLLSAVTARSLRSIRGS